MYFSSVTIRLSPSLSRREAIVFDHLKKGGTWYGILAFALPNEVADLKKVAQELYENPYPSGKRLVLVITGEGDSLEMVTTQVADLVGPAVLQSLIITIGAGRLIRASGGRIFIHQPKFPKLVRPIPAEMVEQFSELLSEHFELQPA